MATLTSTDRDDADGKIPAICIHLVPALVSRRYPPLAGVMIGHPHGRVPTCQADATTHSRTPGARSWQQ